MQPPDRRGVGHSRAAHHVGAAAVVVRLKAIAEDQKLDER